MDIGLARALTAASPIPHSKNDQAKSAASGSPGSAAVSAVAVAHVPVSGGKLEAIASQLQAFLNTSQRDIEFRVDADTHVQVVTVRDSVSGDVIRQMPGEDVLRVLKNLGAQQGTFLNEEA
jgi:flagellar protein FlaG